VTVRKTFLWTYFGSALGGIWLMALGALRAAVAGGKNVDAVAAIGKAADGIFDGFGTIVLLFSALGLISVTALNMYGGSLTLISAADSFKRIRPTLAVRVVTIGLTALISLVIALQASSDFLDNFESFLLLVLYLFIPWTAVNLIDYYVVRRGHYAVAEIFKPRGIYGRWGWRGIAAYLIGRWCRSSRRRSSPGRSRRRSTAPTSRSSSDCRSRAGSTGCSPARSTWPPSGGSRTARRTRWSTRPPSPSAPASRFPGSREE
jgi:NCS1 family nucleobase:cation symporter-1